VPHPTTRRSGGFVLHERFRAAGWGEVRPSYGSILVPLFEEDGPRMGEVGRLERLTAAPLPPRQASVSSTGTPPASV
jgi:hypothetical protein